MKALKILTNKDILNELEVSKSKAEQIGAEMRKKYGKNLTRLHLFDYLGINELSVISELVTAHHLTPNI